MEKWYDVWDVRKDYLMWEAEEAGYRWTPSLHRLGVMKRDDEYMEVHCIILFPFVNALCFQLQDVWVCVFQECVFMLQVMKQRQTFTSNSRNVKKYTFAGLLD